MGKGLCTGLAGLLLLLCGVSAAAQSGLFVQLTDTHLGTPAPYETPEQMAAHLRTVKLAIREINEVIHPDFVLLTGDCVSVADGVSSRLFADAIRTIRVPLYVIPGNHDDENVRSGWFERNIGPTRLVIDRPPWYVVAFDGQPFMEPEGEHPKELLDWIDRQLSPSSKPGQIRVVASHYPLHIDAWGPPTRVRKEFQYTGEWALRLDLLFATHAVGAYLAGHTHGEYEVEDELSGVPCLISGATQDGAYRICCEDAGLFSSSQVQVGEWPKVVILQPKARYQGGSSFLDGKVVVRARVLSPGPVSRVEMRAGGGNTSAMSAADEGVWQAEWDTTQAANGRQRIEVLAYGDNGQQGRAAIDVGVANPSRHRR